MNRQARNIAFTALIILDILVLRDTTLSVSRSAIGLGAAAIIAGAIAAGASIWSAKSSSDASEQNRNWQGVANEWNKLYADQATMIQRQWAKEDYDRQNAYNHPAQQMVRLREAGLNPNLVYGNGAQTTAAMIKSADPKAPHADAPYSAPVDFSGIGKSFSDTAQSYAHARQVEADLDMKRSAIALTDIKAANEATKGETSKFDLGLKKELRESVLLGATIRNDRQKVGLASDYAKNSGLNIQNELLYQKYGLNQQQSAKLDAELSSIRVNSALKQLELDMLKSGRSKSDPYYIRALNNIVDQISERTGVDVSIVSDLLKTSKGFKMPKKRVKSVHEQSRENTDRWMKQMKGF